MLLSWVSLASMIVCGIVMVDVDAMPATFLMYADEQGWLSEDELTIDLEDAMVIYDECWLLRENAAIVMMGELLTLMNAALVGAVMAGCKA